MSARPIAFEGDGPPESERYRLLLEITEAVARAQTLPEAIQAISAPVLALTKGDLLNLSLYDQRHGRITTRYWKKNAESGEPGRGVALCHTRGDPSPARAGGLRGRRGVDPSRAHTARRRRGARDLPRDGVPPHAVAVRPRSSARFLRAVAEAIPNRSSTTCGSTSAPDGVREAQLRAAQPGSRRHSAWGTSRMTANT